MIHAEARRGCTGNSKAHGGFRGAFWQSNIFAGLLGNLLVRWNQLRLSLLVGAIYDIAAGLSIAVALQLLSQILPIPYPHEPIYARLCGVLMMGLGALYGAAALTIPYSMTSVFVAIAIRTVGGIFLLVAPFFDTTISRFMAVFGAIDLFFAIWTFVALRVAKSKL